MPSKRKRELVDQDQSTQEHEIAKKQKKNKIEIAESRGAKDSSKMIPLLGQTDANLGTGDEALKIARRLAKREKRKKERSRKRELQKGSNVKDDKSKGGDGNRRSSELDSPSKWNLRGKTLEPNHVQAASKKVLSAGATASSLKHQDALDKNTRKLAKQEKPRLKRAFRGPHEARTESKGGKDGRKGSAETETSEKKTQRRRGQQKKVSAVVEKLPGSSQSGESPVMEKSKKNGAKLLTEPDGNHVSKKRKKKGNEGAKSQETLGKRSKDPVWKISDPIGGHMLDIDPVFSKDEKFLLVAYNASITVYSTTTSLQVRQLQPENKETICTFALSSLEPQHLYFATRSGTIELWDWGQGLRLGTWKLSSSIHSLATSKPSQDDVATDIAADIEADNPETANVVAKKNESSRDITAKSLVYTVDRKTQGQWMLSAHRLTGEGDSGETQSCTLLRQDGPISSFKVIQDGQIIVATSGRQLIIGTRTMPGALSIGEISYVWKIVECPEWITSIDVRARPVQNSENQVKKKNLPRYNLDIVVGGLQGSIHVYEDLLKKLVRSEQAASKNSSMEDVTSRKLHWHRNSVLAVKWSLDGNYIISGGQETVLVIWQLETERTQDVPHLGAPIESIVVSPTGSSYSIRLADNSAMILSTSELRPTFSIAGIQIPSPRPIDGAELPFVPTVDTPYPPTKHRINSTVPACVPSSPGGYLLLAVPPSVTSRQAMVKQNCSYLQMFDLSGGHQISRQALTRTQITTLNMGPESNTIQEPDVTHLQVSYDGQWLVSVDEWMPPKEDVASLSFDQDHMKEEQFFRREIHLKFWSWNNNTKTWELVSRVDNPHSSRSGNPYNSGRVLDLTSDPSSAGFATIGEDGIVKTWKPAIRRRNGLEVRNKNGKILGTWHCKHSVPLESSGPIAPNSILGAKLAYSRDGSILAGGLQSSTPCPIYTIDTYSGEVKSVQTGLYSGPLFGLGIVNKYLVTLSHELCVWDLISDQRQYGVKLRPNSLSQVKQLSMTHLAADADNGLFALAIPEVSAGVNETIIKSRMAVFDPTSPTPLLLASLPSSVTNLLSDTRRKAFYAIDSAAEVRTLAPSAKFSSIQNDLLNETRQASRGLRDIFGNGQNLESIEDGMDKRAGRLGLHFETLTRKSELHEDDAVVVSQDKLSEVFEVGPAYAMPPVAELFEQVASLYGGQGSS